MVLLVVVVVLHIIKTYAFILFFHIPIYVRSSVFYIIYNAKMLPLKPDHNNIQAGIKLLHRRRRRSVIFVRMYKESVYGLFISLSHKLYSKIINDGDYVLFVCIFYVHAYEYHKYHTKNTPWMATYLAYERLKM